MLIQSFSPLTGKKLAQYKTPTISQIARAIENSKRIKEKLITFSISKRAELFNNFKKLLLQKKKQIVNLIHEEVGKPIPDAEYEVIDIVEGIKKYLERIPELKFKQTIRFEENIIPETKFGILHKNIGVIGVIMPWNFPFWLPMTAIVPAVLCGNPVILKPSEYTCGVGLLIERIFKEAGFPEKTIQTVIGGPYIGSQIVQSEEIARIIFVGSTEVGLSIARSRIHNKSNQFTLEMGGNSAALIFEDANIENAILATFWNSCYYAGQTCSRPKRILIQNSIFEKVKKRLLELAKKYNQPENLVNKIGAIIEKNALNVFEYRVNQAVKKGNILLEGGKRLPESVIPKRYCKGNFFPITILEIKNRHVDLIQKETFAPILPLIPFNDLKEATAIANETVYGLSANIFSSNKKTIESLKKNLVAGMLFINDSELAYPGGNYWKGAGQSYLSTGTDEKLELMFEKIIVWDKKQEVNREYWFK